ncbi:Nn.00g012840.m01.CDS01 [Neocucurbitaria sp. VM-36]
MHLYDSSVPSGNAYKVHLLLSHLNTTYKQTSLNILATPSESRKPEFLAINPNGHVPALILDDGTVLTESNAILFYLAEGSCYLPDDRLKRAQVLQWMFFEQFSHEPYVAKWKYRTYWAPRGFDDLSTSQIEQLRGSGQAAINVMENHLGNGEGRKWFVGDNYSIADIALYAYTSHAEALEFKVGQNVREWLERVEKVQGWVRIKKDPTGRNPF